MCISVLTLSNVKSPDLNDVDWFNGFNVWTAFLCKFHQMSSCASCHLLVYFYGFVHSTLQGGRRRRGGGGRGMAGCRWFAKRTFHSARCIEEALRWCLIPWEIQYFSSLSYNAEDVTSTTERERERWGRQGWVGLQQWWQPHYLRVCVVLDVVGRSIALWWLY